MKEYTEDELILMMEKGTPIETIRDIHTRITEYKNLQELFDMAIEKCKTLKSENEDLQGKLDGDAVTFMNLQKEILELKEKLEVRDLVEPDILKPILASAFKETMKKNIQIGVNQYANLFLSTSDLMKMIEASFTKEELQRMMSEISP